MTGDLHDGILLLRRGCYNILCIKEKLMMKSLYLAEVTYMHHFGIDINANHTEV